MPAPDLCKPPSSIQIHLPPTQVPSHLPLYLLYHVRISRLHCPRPRSPGSRLSKQSTSGPNTVLSTGQTDIPFNNPLILTARVFFLLVSETSYWLRSSPSLLFCSTCPTDQALALFIFPF